MKNRLAIIGLLGGRRAYLNVSAEEAFRRYKVDHDYCGFTVADVEIIEFVDEFEVYEAYSI